MSTAEPLCIRAPRRAAIYARVSSQRQAEQATIDSQLAELRQRVREDEHDVEEEHILLDDGYSGSYLDRPGLDRLRDLARERAIDLIYVSTPDRLARRYAHQVILLEELERCGCEVTFLDHVPAEGPEGQLLVQIQGVIAEYERAKIAERTRRGKLHRARQGAMVIGKAPFGYRHVHDTRGEAGRWEINEAEAPMIRDLFAWVAEEGISIRQAAKRLNASPWRTRGGRHEWPTSTVREILNNETYTGVAYYNRRRWVETDRTDATFRITRKTRAEVRPREEWIAIPVPPIIDQQTFVRAHEQLKNNTAFSPRNLKREDEYLLRCLVSCGVCGQAMVAHAHGRHTYYHCTGSVDHVRTARPRPCPAPRVFARDLDQLVWEEITALLSSPQLIRQCWERQHGRHEQHSPDVIETELARLEQRTTDARRQIQRLVDGYQAGFVDGAELSSRRASLEQSISRSSARTTTLEAQRPKWREIEHAWQSLDALCQHAAAGLDMLSFGGRQKLLRNVIERVWVTAWDVTIKLAIPLSTNSHLTTLSVLHPEDAPPVLPLPPPAPRPALPGCLPDRTRDDQCRFTRR
jgi:site-specific DNA recombinase